VALVLLLFGCGHPGNLPTATRRHWRALVGAGAAFTVAGALVVGIGGIEDRARSCGGDSLCDLGRETTVYPWYVIGSLFLGTGLALVIAGGNGADVDGYVQR
jgi:hypothetical protein